jgi:hypothetical protein
MATSAIQSSIWTYAWDLLDVGLDSALAEIGERAGIAGVSLASAYHAGHFLQPRSPKRKTYFPEDGTIYFHPTSKRGEMIAIQPKVADVVAETDVLGELVRRRDQSGLRVSAWTVCLHNTRLGLLHPSAVTRNAFGDPNYYNLCPSNPGARAYVCTLVEDLTDVYKPDIIELESPCFMGFLHEFHHEKDGVGLTAEDDFLLSLCFCNACVARAAKAGANADAARGVVRRWIIDACERARPAPRFPDFPAGGLDAFRPFPALHEFLLWRSEPVTSLVAEIRARAHPASRVVLIDLAEGWLGGCDLHAIGEVCDGAILCVYGLAPEKGAAVVRYGRSSLGPEKYLAAGFRLFHRDVDGPESLSGQVNAAVEAGAEALNFYNYGLIPPARLDWIRAAIEGAA